MTKEPNAPPPEFSVEVDLEEIGRQSKSFHLAPDAKQREAIAWRLGAPAVNSLEGDVTLKVAKTHIRASGSVRATLTRMCVASLEPMTEAIDEEFDIEFLRQAPDETAREAEEDALDDLIEIHENPVLDVGELLVQQLSLAMDPFPRKEGATSLVEQYGRTQEESPFAVLRGAFGKDEENQ